ncbi:MAG TPA: type II toxin-antitoxin system VapC family toxin [Bryobacteraceae bacterium]|nr:type II toxin-antitoxin system VapC family toxin [Bryobacteraceae bacterium]
MRVLLDTNCLTDGLRGTDPELARKLEEAVDVHIPFVTLAEIKAGFLVGRRTAENEGLLAAFLRLPGVSVLFADHQTTDVYARLFQQLRRAGTPIPTNDLWIASLAVQHQLMLLSRDEHFAKLPQVSKG